MTSRRRMHWAVISCAVLSGVCGVAQATEDIIPTWTSVAFEVRLPTPGRTAAVSARLDASGGRIETLELRMGHEVVDLPRVLYADLNQPRLQSLSLVASGNPDNLVVKFRFGPQGPPRGLPPGCEEADLSLVVIAIEGTKAIGRFIATPGASGTMKWQDLKDGALTAPRP